MIASVLASVHWLEFPLVLASVHSLEYLSETSLGSVLVTPLALQLEFLSETSLGSVLVKLLALRLVLDWVRALEFPSEMA